MRDQRTTHVWISSIFGICPMFTMKYDHVATHINAVWMISRHLHITSHQAITTEDNCGLPYGRNLAKSWWKWILQELWLTYRWFDDNRILGIQPEVNDHLKGTHPGKTGWFLNINSVSTAPAVRHAQRGYQRAEEDRSVGLGDSVHGRNEISKLDQLFFI